VATMEDAIYALVTGDPRFTAQAGLRLYPIDFPDAPTYPAALYMVPSRLHHYHHGGSSNLKKARVQFDAYGETWDEVVQLGDSIIAILGGYRGMVPVDGGDPVEVQAIFCTIDRDATESGTRTSGPRVRRRLLEFTVWV
jgi:hypothetical protein